MSLFRSIRTHWLKNVHSAEYTSRLNLYYRCLLNWSHYQSPRRESALALASIRLDEMEKGWGFLSPRNSLANSVGDFFTRQIGKALTRDITQRSCLAGLSRSVVTAPPKVTLKAHTAEPMVRYERVEALAPRLPAATIQRTSVYASSNMFRK